VEAEETDPSLLTGWFVVEAGRRSAWPFINVADPGSDREVRLFIDSTFDVLPRWPRLRQHDDQVLIALDSTSGRTIGVVETPNLGLRLTFDDGTALSVDGEANDLTSHSPWWVGRRTGG
jgi:hypothetical protein